MLLQCARCGEDKDASAFNRDARNRRGYQSWCRTCTAVRNKEGYRKEIKASATGWCSRCKQNKSADEFNAARTTKTGLQTYCRSCAKGYQAERYAAAPETRIAAVQALKQQVTDLVRSAKDVPCADCGVRYHYCVMDFDHVRGVKLFSISTRNTTLERTLAEIAKCEVVCANCHRLRTFKRRQQKNMSSSEDCS
jgi:hypothetical protein